jgi:deoxyribose-phosphate aldolase
MYIYFMSSNILLNKYIEHTILKPDATIQEVEQICHEALKYQFAGVCVPAYFLETAVELLKDTDIDIVTVIGFPYGYNSLMSKFEEAEDAIHRGAQHIDMVINIAAVKNNDWDTVENEIDTIFRLAKRENCVFKLIAETGLMSEIELELICKIANELKIDYLKTSTGVNGPGADVEVVTSLREMLDKDIRIKASGGIKTKESALELIAAGADRIGASRGVDMMA